MTGPLREYRVSVVSVGGGASSHDAALAWTCVSEASAIYLDETHRDSHGTYAAKRWWAETDQCSDCEVTLRFESEHFGRKIVFTRRVALTIQTVARVVPVDAVSESESGVES